MKMRILMFMYTCVQLPVFQTETNGTTRKQKFIMGQRNWCQVDWDRQTGELNFDIRVEKERGLGQTVRCVFNFLQFRFQCHFVDLCGVVTRSVYRRPPGHDHSFMRYLSARYHRPVCMYFSCPHLVYVS